MPTPGRPRRRTVSTSPRCPTEGDERRSGALLREHRGVYRVGHWAPSVEARYLAAVLACGDDACLSGQAAAHLLGLLRGGRVPRPEVSTPLTRHVFGVTVRRSSIGPLDRTTPAQVEAVLERRGHVPGESKLRQVLSGEAHVTLSALERRFLELIAEHGLPLPRTNRVAGGYRVDCRWEDRRLTAELDSYRFHHSRHAWEQDRRREREARARGDDFVRYTWSDVFEAPAATMAELRRRSADSDDRRATCRPSAPSAASDRGASRGRRRSRRPAPPARRRRRRRPVSATAAAAPRR